MWFVLVGFNTTFEQDIERLNYLRSRNQNAYVQRYNWTEDRRYINLAMWANQHGIFKKMAYREFLEETGRH